MYRNLGRDSAAKQLKVVVQEAAPTANYTRVRRAKEKTIISHIQTAPTLTPPRLVPEQVAAHTDDSVPGSVQTNVALEGCPVPLPFALPAAAVAAAARSVAIVAALPGRESSSAGRPPVT